VAGQSTTKEEPMPPIANTSQRVLATLTVAIAMLATAAALYAPSLAGIVLASNAGGGGH
jgi:hypothetical protein